MKIAMLGSQEDAFQRVFSQAFLEKLSRYGTVSKRISETDLEANKVFLAECEVAFSTWGMLKLTEAQIKTYFPKLKVLFYAAGTVQEFAKPFLHCGVQVLSAAAANAVPVAEYVFAQISLATKGYFMAQHLYKPLTALSAVYVHASKGNYHATVGLVGLGAIGSMVAEKLKQLDVKVRAYDPFVSDERAEALGVQLVSLEELFSTCDVISNHLANKKELENIFNKTLFQRMKKHTVFINTGRGAQVNEKDLAAYLLTHPSSVALIDVIKHEMAPMTSPLFWCPNAYVTPHMAGSSGNEPQRMAEYMLEELDRYLKGEAFLYAVKEENLATMA